MKKIRDKLKSKDIACGKPDKNGFANTYIDGKKTNVRLLIWSKDQIDRLEKAILTG